MEKIKEHSDYLIGITITGLIGAIASVFGPKTVNMPIILDILLTTFTVLILCSIIGGIIFGITGVFTKNFTFARFIKTSTIICIVWTITSIIYTLKSFM
jgi:hypothetical protein